MVQRDSSPGAGRLDRSLFISWSEIFSSFTRLHASSFHKKEKDNLELRSGSRVACPTELLLPPKTIHSWKLIDLLNAAVSRLNRIKLNVRRKTQSVRRQAPNYVRGCIDLAMFSKAQVGIAAPSPNTRWSRISVITPSVNEPLIDRRISKKHKTWSYCMASW